MKESKFIKLVTQLEDGLTLEQKFIATKALLDQIKLSSFETFELELRENFKTHYVPLVLSMLLKLVLDLKLNEEEAASTYAHMLFDMYEELLHLIEAW